MIYFSRNIFYAIDAKMSCMTYYNSYLTLTHLLHTVLRFGLNTFDKKRNVIVVPHSC